MRLVGLPEVMGIYEIGQRLGVSKSRARQLVDSRSFPPGRKLHMGWVWSVEDVEAWIVRNRPQLVDDQGDA